MAKKPGKIERYERRFGVIALEKGFITAVDLIKALSIQADENIKKRTPQIDRRDITGYGPHVGQTD